MDFFAVLFVQNQLEGKDCSSWSSRYILLRLVPVIKPHDD